MIVVADSSPINYLVLIGHVDLLASLFGEVVVPEAVSVELQSSAAPEKVRWFMASAPSWLRVQSVGEEQLARIGEAHLHPGEREAIALAELLTADYLVIDEKAGRLAARM